MQAHPAPEEEQAIPLTEAAFLVGVSVQALRQRIKRGTLEGAEATDQRGQTVAGILPSELQRAFPERPLAAAGATQSNAPSRALGYPPAAHAFDAEADLEHGGMAPEPRRPAPVAAATPAATGGFNGWSIGLLVAIAAVAVAGLVTGAREARAATRIAEDARDRELLLLERLRDQEKSLELARQERDEALATVRTLQLELEGLRDR